MLELLLIGFILLWVLGYISIPGLTIPNFSLFNFNGRDISLIDLLLFLLIIAAIGVLPSPLRQVAFGILILWVLATFGILAIPGLASIAVLALILGLVATIFSKGKYFTKKHDHTIDQPDHTH